MGDLTKGTGFYATVPPLQLQLFTVACCADGAVQGTYAQLNVNTPDFGAMTPMQYRLIANRGPQGLKLAQWSFRRAATLMATGKMPDGFVCLYVPLKMLRRDSLAKAMAEMSQRKLLPDRAPVIDLSAEVLYENAEETRAKMLEAKQRYGVKFLISQYGDEYCPALRLESFAFDYVMLDSGIGSREALSTAATQNAVRMAKECGHQVILGVPAGDDLRSAAADIGIDLCLLPGFPEGREDRA